MTAQPEEEVPDEGADNVTYLTAPLPDFEGQTVEGYDWKISGVAPVSSGTTGVDLPMVSVDDRVRMVGEFRVMGVRHYIDKKSGMLKREAILAPISMVPCPWDPSDPKDDGVIRKTK